MLLRCESLESPMSQMGQQHALIPRAHRFRYAPISGPYLKPADTTETCHKETLADHPSSSLCRVSHPKYRYDCQD
jgi:hypothetical protein